MNCPAHIVVQVGGGRMVNLHNTVFVFRLTCHLILCTYVCTLFYMHHFYPP